MEMEDVMENINEVSKKRVSIKAVAIVSAAVILVLAVIASLSVGLIKMGETNEQLKKLLEEEQKIDVTYVGNKLEAISELATAKMTYNGIIHFEEGNIPIITKKEFYMSYRVSLKAGFDLSKAKIVVTDHTVTIDLPEAEIYEPNVDEKSFQFFDKSIGIFSSEEMSDLAQAISEAKSDALAQPETQEMKSKAEEQAVILLTALLEGQIGERDLIINIG